VGDIADLHHGAVAINGRAGRVSGPGSTNGNVEEEVEGAVGERVPDVLVVDASTADLLKLLTISIPGDGLVCPRALAAVVLESPGVPALIRDGDAGTETCAFVADTAGVDVTVGSSVTRQLAIDLLHDVELTTSRPGCSVSDRVSEVPESGPDALFLVGTGGTESEGRLNSGELARLGSVGVLGFNTARGPSILSRAVSPWNNLEGAPTGELKVPIAVGVDFQLGVDVQVTLDDVPFSTIGEVTAVSSKVILPDKVETAVGGSVASERSASNGKKREDSVGKHVSMSV